MSTDSSVAVRDACDRARAALQGGEVPLALRYYEYAQRMEPENAKITLAIGAARFTQRDPRAAEAFALIAERHDLQEAWLGLAAAQHAMGEDALAAEALRNLISRHGHVRGTANVHLHDAIATRRGSVGWCSLSADGRLRATLPDATASSGGVEILFDGTPVGVRPRRLSHDNGRRRVLYVLPETWRHAREISVCLNGQHLLGSPLEASVIGHIEGLVTASGGDLSGWAWYPYDPDCAPLLTLRDANGVTQRLLAGDPATEVQLECPLARPRRLHVSAADLRGLAAPLAVQDVRGMDLYGSPLDPFLEQHSAAGAAELVRSMFPATGSLGAGHVDLPLLAMPADIIGIRPVTRRPVRSMGADVVIAVHGNRDRSIACIKSVLTSLPSGTRCIVVEDASPDAALVETLRQMAERAEIVLYRQPKNRGFPAAANVGIRAASQRDVILLNSDTLVPPGWIERLADAAYSAPDIGTATPLSNNATVFSYPREGRVGPFPDQATTISLDRFACRANGNMVVDVPTAHGFCVYLRRDCLDQVGLLRDDLFAQGYGEENDFCIRARHLGWRHVAVAGVFVAHAGGGSFGNAKADLLARNLQILNRLHPGYDALIASFRSADPLAEARFRMDALRWRHQRSRKGAVILITHARTGGVARRVKERCGKIAATGLRPIVLSPIGEHGRTLCQLADASGVEFPNLRFNLAQGLGELAGFLREERPLHVELHHFVGHDPVMLGLPRALDVPYDVVVHDYAWVCPRIMLVGADKRYCGEPGGDACEACYADIGSAIEEDIRPSLLRQRSQRLLAGAQRVIVPARDVASRLARYFPDIACVVTPWEANASPVAPADYRVSRLRVRVVVVGAIGIEKGYEYLLACARHVAAKRLALEFMVVGHTSDDRRLLDTGVVHITGGYDETEAIELIRAQDAELGFLPALWPETWSYTLTQIWQAGLDVVAFDLGAPAERIRETRRGALLPIGLPPAATCRALLAYRSGTFGKWPDPVESHSPVAVA